MLGQSVRAQTISSKWEICYFQCRRYKGSDEIAKKAEFIYSRFKNILMIGDGPFIADKVPPIFQSFHYIQGSHKVW